MVETKRKAEIRPFIGKATTETMPTPDPQRIQDNQVAGRVNSMRIRPIRNIHERRRF